MATRIRKVCAKCQHRSMARPRELKCKRIEHRMGGRFYCYGDLTAVEGPQVPEGQTPERLHIRVDYETKLADAHEQMLAAITRVKRATTSVSLWVRRVRHYERQIESRDHPKPARPKPIKKTRRIEVE